MTPLSSLVARRFRFSLFQAGVMEVKTWRGGGGQVGAALQYMSGGVGSHKASTARMEPSLRAVLCTSN